MKDEFETEEYYAKFAEYSGFEKIKSIMIKNLQIDADDINEIFCPMSKAEFLKSHFEEKDVWWDKEDMELFFENAEDVVEYYETEWEEFKKVKLEVKNERR